MYLSGIIFWRQNWETDHFTFFLKDSTSTFKILRNAADADDSVNISNIWVFGERPMENYCDLRRACYFSKIKPVLLWAERCIIRIFNVKISVAVELWEVLLWLVAGNEKWDVYILSCTKETDDGHHGDNFFQIWRTVQLAFVSPLLHWPLFVVTCTDGFDCIFKRKRCTLPKGCAITRMRCGEDLPLDYLWTRITGQLFLKR